MLDKTTHEEKIRGTENAIIERTKQLFGKETSAWRDPCTYTLYLNSFPQSTDKKFCVSEVALFRFFCREKYCRVTKVIFSIHKDGLLV